MLAVIMAAKGSAIDLEVAGSGPLAAVIPFPPFLTMCSSLACLSQCQINVRYCISAQCQNTAQVYDAITLLYYGVDSQSVIHCEFLLYVLPLITFSL